MITLRILTYNIHKGFKHLGPHLILHEIRDSLRESKADILFLQEVVGENQIFAERDPLWPELPQFEYLADEVWDHYAYGKNAVTSSSHHGNAILSKFPIESFENIDISTNSRERRGLLHARVYIPSCDRTVNLMNVHLNLFHSDRAIQAEKINERIRSLTDPRSPLILAGDFNDWPQRLSPIFEESSGLKEAFMETEGRSAKTFPSIFPFLRLDRIYFRELHLKQLLRFSGFPWSDLSDHLPIAADFEIEARS